jgi:hypothetical protein
MAIWAQFSEAQNGQLITNLARAFHLPRAKAKAALLSMVGELTACIDEQTLSRRTLARLVELLGKGVHEQVLDTPMLLGTTSTQVIGSEALTIIAGREESKRIAQQSAAAADISVMIAEYLLPVIASLVVGALARETRGKLVSLSTGEPVIDEPPSDATGGGLQLPLAVGTASFSGSVGGSLRVAGNQAAARHYDEIAAAIGGTGRLPGAPDATTAVRRIVAAGLGVPLGPIGWMVRLQRRGAGVINAAHGELLRRLRAARERGPGRS